MKKNRLIALFVLFTESLLAQITLPALFSDNMVLQQQFESVNTEYIKIVAVNYGPLPEWHNGAGNDSWIFVDEIVVE